VPSGVAIDVQESFPNATVTVYQAGTTTPAAIFSDKGLSIPQANPFTSGSTGQWSFYAAPATFDILFTGGGLPQPYKLTDVTIQGSSAHISDLLGPAVLSACDYAGVDAAAKIATAFTALPASGGVIDIRCMVGNQTFGSDPFTGMNKPVTMIVGPATFTSSVNLNVPANVALMLLEGALISMNTGTTLTIRGPMQGSSLSQHFTGAGSISFLTTLVPEVYPQWWGATGNGSTDDTSAIQAAYNSVVAPSGYTLVFPPGAVVVFPAGVYKITSQITQSGSYIYTRGAGMRATQLLFAPTANGTCFQVTRPTGASGTYGGISNLEFYSTDTTYVKTALNLISVSEFYVEDVAVMGSQGPGGVLWHDTTNTSIAIQTNGHEAVNLNRLSLYADRPIYIGKDPHTALDADHFHFSNFNLIAHANPCIDCQPNIFVSHLTVDGYQAWVAGLDGFRYISNGTGAIVGARPNLRFENVIREQVEDAVHHWMNIQMSGGDTLINFSMRNGSGVFDINGLGTNQGHGILLRGATSATIENIQYMANGTALDLDSTSSSFIFLNNTFVAGGGTLSVVGFTGLMNYNQATKTLSFNTFDTTGLVNLANQTTINELNSSGVSKRLLGINASNQVAIDQDALGTVLGSSLLAAADNTANLGAAAIRWANAFLMSLKVDQSVVQGGGMKHARFASGVTAATLGSTASTTFSWPTPFADANYTVTAFIEAAQGFPQVLFCFKAAASITVYIGNFTAAIASGTIDVIAFHD
jgi:hypothetical protein